jgi:hypothetical protein
MNIFFATFLSLLMSSATAFTLSTASTTRATIHSVQLHATATELIQEALAISKQYGPTSPEAAVAWDAVEEVNAADNR